MIPNNHPLIEAITQPLAGNAEMKLSASQFLEQTFDPDHPSVPQAQERLERQDRRRFTVLGKIVIWVLAITLLGFAMLADLRAFLEVAKIHDWEGLEDIKLPPVHRKLNDRERLLLGDPDADDLTNRKRLFESDPTNPAYFAEYAVQYCYQNDGLPPDFLETAERIDPENSFFIYLAAGVTGRESVGRIPHTTSRSPERIVAGVRLRPLPTEQAYTITDRVAYEEALKLIKKASGMPKFRTYTNQMTALRAHHIPTDNLVSYESGYDFFVSTISCGVLSLYGVFDLFSARAEELSKSGDESEFQLIASQQKALLHGLARNEDISSPNEYNYWIIAYVTAVNFHAAAERLGLNGLAETYRKQRDALVAREDDIRLRRAERMDVTPRKRASPLGFSGLLNRNHSTVEIPPLSDSYLKPMRLVEHELLGRFGLIAVSLMIMIGALVVYLFRFLPSKAILLPAKRIAKLLGFSDWVWIFGFGIALPVLVFFYISRLSPVSGRDYSCSHFEFAFPGIHLSALLLTLLLAPAIIARWRLTRRAAAFSFGSRLDLLAPAVIGVLLVYAVVAFPLVMLLPSNDLTQFGLSLPLLGWLGFVFFNGLRIFLGSARSRLIQTATSIAVIPAYPLAIVTLCLTLPIYIKAERSGLAEDKRNFVDPVTSELVGYDYQVAAQMRKEINAIMGIE